MVRMLFGVFLSAAILLGGLIPHEAVSSERPKSSIRGELVKIDSKNSLLVIKSVAGNKREEIILYIAPDTAVRVRNNIKLGYEKDALSDLKVGDKIGATYLTDAQDRKIAHSILKLTSIETQPKERGDLKGGGDQMRQE